MELSIFLARALGIYALVGGLAILMNRKYYRKVAIAVFKNEALVLFGASLDLFFGVLIVTSHNVWSGWPIAITLLGYVGLVEGTLFLLFPNSIREWRRGMMNKSAWMFFGALSVVLGLFLCYQGFVV